MSTTININVKNQNKGLIEQLKLQQLVARTAQLEKESRVILEREATAERTAALATQGLNPQGNVLSGRLNVPAFRRDEPAANRTGSELIVGGVVFKYTGLSVTGDENTSTLNSEVTVSIADIKSSTPSVFIFPGQTTTFTNIEYFGGPSDSINGVTFWTDDQNAPSYISRVPPANSYLVGNIITTYFRIDKSFYFVVPTGDGGAFVVLHINDTIDIIKNTTTKQGSAERSVRTCTGESQGITFSYYRSNEATVTENTTVNRQTQEFFKRSDVLCFKVKNGLVTKIETPPALIALVESYNSPPPYESNATFTYQSEVNSIYREYNPNGDTCGFGTFGLTENISFNQINTDVGYYDSRLNKPFGLNADLSLIKYLGGTAIGPNPRSDKKAWGPSFVLAMDKAGTDLTAEQSTDYTYIENTIVGAKPRLYASPCTLSGTCPSASTVGWDESKTRPATLTATLNLDNFKANPANTLSIPAYATAPGSGYEVLFHTNWKDPARCRQALSKLGLTP